MIEKTVLTQLQTAAPAVDFYMEEPENPSGSYVILEKTAGSMENQIMTATIAVQTYGPSLLEAATLADAVKGHMLELPETVATISRCSINSGPYNYTDEETHWYRYQCVFNLVYKE